LGIIKSTMLRYTFLLFMALAFTLTGKAQENETPNDTISLIIKERNTEILRDTIIIPHNIIYDEDDIQWQYSPNNRLWINLRNAHSENLIYDGAKTGFFRAKLKTDSCNFFSDTTFIFDVENNDSYFNISDKDSTLKIEWDFNIPSRLISYFLISIEGDDTTIVVQKRQGELLLPRKMEYYNKKFTIEAVASGDFKIPQQVVRYENNYSRFFNCKNNFIAHRGLSGTYPENTRIAFEKAAEGGFEYVECDVRLTKDKVWVLNHDKTIDRTSERTGYLSDYNYETLRHFNWGYSKQFGKKYPQEILTLRDFVILCKEKNIKPIIEIKDERLNYQDVKNLFDILTEYLAYDKYSIQCFSEKTLKRMRRIDANAILGLLTDKYNSSHISILNDLYPCFYNLRFNEDLINKPFRYNSNRGINHIFAVGTYICTWKVNDLKYFDLLKKNNLFILTDILPPSNR